MAGESHAVGEGFIALRGAEPRIASVWPYEVTRSGRMLPKIETRRLGETAVLAHLTWGLLRGIVRNRLFQ